jgi:hypothetical protein
MMHTYVKAYIHECIYISLPILFRNAKHVLTRLRIGGAPKVSQNVINASSDNISLGSLDSFNNATKERPQPIELTFAVRHGCEPFGAFKRADMADDRRKAEEERIPSRGNAAKPASPLTGLRPESRPVVTPLSFSFLDNSADQNPSFNPSLKASLDSSNVTMLDSMNFPLQGNDESKAMKRKKAPPKPIISEDEINIFLSLRKQLRRTYQVHRAIRKRGSMIKYMRPSVLEVVTKHTAAPPDEHSNFETKSAIDYLHELNAYVSKTYYTPR